MTPQIFLLSPANCSGQRAKMLLSEQADFALARQLRESGAPLGDVFSFLSGLYFRGKLTYARAFARPLGDSSSVLVITAGQGLLSADTPIGLTDVCNFADIAIDPAELRYREPLTSSASALAKSLSADARVIFLGSIATDKYTSILYAAVGDRLLFPEAFIGRGDMSRGSLLLRSVDEGRELDYLPVSSTLSSEIQNPKSKI